MDKVVTPTMGTMTKKSHPFHIKSQLVESQSLEDMNFDIDNEAISYSQPCDSFLSPTKPVLIDTVDWANSQPVALKSLLSEARKISGKRPIKYEPTWPTSDSSSSQVASTSRAPADAKSRPLRRTNSNARARLGPEAASTSSKPPPAPDGAFWGKDRLTVLVACQNVSERMDENAFALAAQVQRTAPTKTLSKRKPRDLHLSGISKIRRSTMSHSLIHERDGVNRWEHGRQRASIHDVMPNYQRSTSVPAVAARPMQRFLSSSSSADSSTDFSPDSPDTSMMDIDTYLQDETPPSSLPPSVFPTNQPPQLRAPSRYSTSISPTDASSLAPASQSQIHLHPLLTQKQKPKTVKQPPLPPPPPPPLQQGPLLSQPTRPPTLGMRRAHTAPVTGTHVMPTRQKAFKPPLLSQPARSQSKTDTAPVCGVTSSSKQRRPSLEPETNADPDSSFGDISLGVDDEELEMTMRQYD